MTILLVSCGWLITGLVAGALIEAHRNNRDTAEARRDADMWHDEYHTTNQALQHASQHIITWKRRSQAWEAAAKKWHTQAREQTERADSQAVLLAALGADSLKDNP
jgi:hypothetical protein